MSNSKTTNFISLVSSRSQNSCPDKRRATNDSFIIYIGPNNKRKFEARAD